MRRKICINFLLYFFLCSIDLCKDLFRAFNRSYCPGNVIFPTVPLSYGDGNKFKKMRKFQWKSFNAAQSENFNVD